MSVASSRRSHSVSTAAGPFSVIDHEWHPDGDELTPTSKLKRRAIAAKYAAEIEAMYSQTA